MHCVRWLFTIAVHVLVLVVVVVHVLSLHVLVYNLVLLGSEVQLLYRGHLFVKTLNLKLVGVHLRLIILQLLHHFFQLVRPLLQVLLVHRKFLSNLRTTLFSKDVLQLDVQLLLFLDEHIFLCDFFSLCNQTLLEALDLLDHLVRLRVSALKLPPPVDIEGLFKLVRQVLCLLLLL